MQWCLNLYLLFCSFVESFKIGPDDVQVGIVSFSIDVEKHIYMNDYSNKRDLQNAILEIAQRGGKICIWLVYSQISTNHVIVTWFI